MFNFSPSAVGWSVVVAVTVSVAVLVGLWATSAGSVWADAGPKASCIGIESSSISPPRSSEELTGGRAELAHFLNDLEGPPGAIYSFVAKLHEGSHEACDEATE